ncbi:hypothetical protein PAXRUDRAFT_831129 [Paxillus rubicundulus Ve08.2h10]|uniref:Uncharacterized protein n=1 Tax=Paxillus rubicundulus Ve08.2h10 TaxID=930991 RepID=A0A0D0DJ55_9AGAM|nr:hypothetical protein PAXRUDRAFT_831129 [Paxillus rubicundulus Ve08.2h10]
MIFDGECSSVTRVGLTLVKPRPPTRGAAASPTVMLSVPCPRPKVCLGQIQDHLFLGSLSPSPRSAKPTIECERNLICVTIPKNKAL